MAKGMTPFQRHLRLRGISQTTLATKVGASISIVSCWATGERMPSSRFIKRAAAVMGVTPSRLLVLIERSKREPTTVAA